MLSRRSAVITAFQGIFLSSLIIGCGSGFSLTGTAMSNPSNLRVGGSLSGLASGQSVSLTNNGIDELVLDSDNEFLFPEALDYGTYYNVEVSQHPVGQTCSVTGASGVVVGGKDISSVSVECSDGNLPEITVTIDSEGYTSGGGYDFGAISVNGATTLKEITINIENDGNGSALELDADNVIIGGNDPHVFHIDTMNFFLSNPIQPGDMVPLIIRFENTDQGEFSATLNLPNNDTDEGDFTLELFGTITDNDEPEIQVLYGVENIQNGSTITLPEAANGVVNNYLITVKNGGQNELNYTSAALDIYQSGTPEFALVTGLASLGPIQENDEESLAFSFSPGFAGLFTETFTIDNNDSNESPFTFTVEINSYDPQLAELERVDNPGVFISNGGLVDFGQARVNETSITVAMNIVNNGQRDLEITGNPSISGTHASDFSIIGFPSQTTLTPSESLSFSLRFSPTDFNFRTAQIDIPVDDPNQGDGELNVNLGGEGIGVLTALLIDSGDSDTNVTNQSPNSTGAYDGFFNGSAIFDYSRFNSVSDATTMLPVVDGADFGSLEINGLNGNSTNLPDTTWSAWVKPENPEVAPFKFIFSTNDVGNTNKRGLFINQDTYFVGDGSSSMDTTVAVAWGEWQHVAVTYTASAIYFYINGREISLGAGDAVNQDGTDNIRIGALNNGGGTFAHPFEGSIDGVTVTNYARSDSEMRLLANRAPVNTILAYFPLNAVQNYDNVAYTGDNGSTGGSPLDNMDLTGAAGEAKILTEAGPDSIDLSAAAAGLSDSGGGISFWFQPSDPGSGEDIFSYDLAGNLRLNWNGGVLQLIHSVGGSLVLANNLPAGAWYQVTITWSSTADHLTVSMFGDEIGSMNFPSGTTNANFVIGPMDAAISEVTFYNQSLSNNAVEAIGSNLAYGNKHFYPLGNQDTDYGTEGNALTNAVFNTSGHNGVDLRGSGFDGTTQQKQGSDTLFNYGYSVSAWVRFDVNRATFAGTDRQVIVAKGDNILTGSGANDEFFIFIDRDAQNDVLACEVADTAGNRADVELHEWESRFFTKTWYHVACSYRQGQLRLFLDGKEVDSENVVGLGVIGNGTETISIGALSSGGSYFDGIIDDVRIWDRAISANEASRLVGNSNRGQLARYPGAAFNNNVANGLDLTDFGVTQTDSGGYDGGNHFAFDGVDDYMEGASDALWDQPRAMTISTWVKIDDMSLTATPPERPIFIKGNTVDDFSNMSTQLTWYGDNGANGGTLKFKKADGAALNTARERHLESQYKDGEWFHLALLASEDYIQMFIDGRAGDLSTGGDPFQANGDPFYFGSLAGSNAFGGGLDRTRIYGRTLSYAEILNEARNFNPRQLPGLRLWLEPDHNTMNGGGAASDGGSIDTWVSTAGQPTNAAAYQLDNVGTDPEYNASGDTGLPAVDFDGTQQLDETSADLFGSSGAVYEFAACWVGNGTGGDYFSITNGTFEFRASTDRLRMNDGTTTDEITYSSTTASRIFCMRYVQDATDYRFDVQVDGTALVSVTASLLDTDLSAYTTFYLGGNGANLLNGQISELLVWRRPISAEGLDNMNCYLSAKHGIAVPLTCN